MNVLIATHGRAELFATCIRSVLEAAKHCNCNRIVVVENGGDFGTREICNQKDPNGIITILTTSVANKSIALNHGISACRNGLIFMTDDDVVLPRNLLTKYEVAAANNQSKTFFGGPTVPRYEEEPAPWLKNMLPQSARGYKKGKNQSNSETQFIGFNWAAYKQDMLSAGGFYPHFGPGSPSQATGQESYMQRRLIESGCKPHYIPDAEVTHVVPTSRCNQTWALNRAFRQGVEIGIKTYIEDNENRINLLQQYKYLSLRHSVLSFLFPTEKRQFLGRFYQEATKGIKHGFQYAESQSLTYPSINTLKNLNANLHN